MELYGRIRKGDFVYNLWSDALCKLAEPFLLGEVTCLGCQPAAEPICQVSCVVEDGRLFLTGGHLLIRQEDLPRLPKLGQRSIRPDYVYVYGKDTFLQRVEVYAVTVTGLYLPLHFTGEIESRQYFLDEQELNWGQMTHRDKSLFVFQNGLFWEEKSLLTQKRELYKTPHCWTEETAALPAEKNELRRLFYIDPEGSLMQHEFLMGFSIFYLREEKIPDHQIRKLLSAKVPVLRSEYMVRENGVKLHRSSCDAVLLAIANRDEGFLRQLYPYIRFDRYPDYPRWMVEELFDLDEEEPLTEELLTGMLPILTLFAEKGLRTKAALLPAEQLKALPFPSAEKALALLTTIGR